MDNLTLSHSNWDVGVGNLESGVEMTDTATRSLVAGWRGWIQPLPGLAPLHALRLKHDLSGGHRTLRAGLVLRGPRRPVHGDGRKGLPRMQASLHPDRALGPLVRNPLGSSSQTKTPIMWILAPRACGSGSNRASGPSSAWTGSATAPGARNPTCVDRH